MRLGVGYIGVLVFRRKFLLLVLGFFIVLKIIFKKLKKKKNIIWRYVFWGKIKKRVVIKFCVLLSDYLSNEIGENYFS